MSWHQVWEKVSFSLVKEKKNIFSEKKFFHNWRNNRNYYCSIVIPAWPDRNVQGSSPCCHITIHAKNGTTDRPRMGRCGKRKSCPWHVWCRSAERSKCSLVKAGSTRGDTGRRAETMRVNPHVTVNAGTASWAAEPGWENGHQPQETQAGTWTRGHELETKRWEIGKT